MVVNYFTLCVLYLCVYVQGQSKNCPSPNGLSVCLSRCKKDRHCGFGELCCRNSRGFKTCACPTGTLNCLMPYCQANPTCPRFPKAVCKESLCNSCVGGFFVRRRNVTKKCRKTKKKN